MRAHIPVPGDPTPQSQVSSRYQALRRAWVQRPVARASILQRARRSPIPCQPRTQPITSSCLTYRICKVHLLLRAVLGCKQVSHRKEEQEQLHGAPDWIVLVARLDVAHCNRRPGDPLQICIGLVQEPDRRILYFLEVHCRVWWGCCRGGAGCEYSQSLGGCGDSRR